MEEFILNVLSSLRRSVVQHKYLIKCKHSFRRDLAARNVLIDEHRTLKISDFGLSRSGIYVNPKNKVVPLRWLSIEAMRDNLYSDKSDIWAFGVVLWEIGSLGKCLTMCHSVSLYLFKNTLHYMGLCCENVSCSICFCTSISFCNGLKGAVHKWR